MSQTLETWVAVVGHEGRYEVSSHGRVMALFSACRGRHKPGRILKPRKLRHGYLCIGLNQPGMRPEYRTIHRMVLESFVGPKPDGKEARHLDGKRGHNDLENLEWGTKQQNANDRVQHGTTIRGEAVQSAKLTTAQVREIRELWSKGHSVRSIAKRYSICTMQAWRIANRKRWSHVT